MKFYFWIISSLLFLLLSATLSGCGKRQEDKIVGEWNKISVGQIPEGTSISWTFSADHKLYRYTKSSSDSIIIDTAQWSLTIHFASDNVLLIDNLDEFNNGKHFIHELGDYLKLQRFESSNGNTEAAFLWNEFEKK